MNGLHILKSALICGASIVTLARPADARQFDVPRGDLSTALDAYMQQAGVLIVYSDDVVRGHKSEGAIGNYTEIAALTQILRGTGFTTRTLQANAIGIVREKPKPVEQVAQVSRRAAAPAAAMPAAVETVVVTAQKKSENIQNVPIAVTALSQAQLTARQIAGGPDLLRDVPNMNFTKTNFSGYDIELRGIGTQAISVTTDPAVAVAFNDTPFIRNHFFEQEFFDLQDVEVLLGPQGTLYGRNATAGVVNLKSALPDDSYEAMLSADMGNFSNRRLEAMLNIPIVGDKLDIRFAGEWTKRNGYTIDTDYNTHVDGRDLWSGRMTIGWKPTSDLQTYLVWEHFQEDDDRLRSGKQLCKTSEPPVSISEQFNGYSFNQPVPFQAIGGEQTAPLNGQYLSQGCKATSLYSPSAYEVPNGYSLPYDVAAAVVGLINGNIDPYAETSQSTNLRQIQSQVLPTYRAKNDTLELNAAYSIDRNLTLTSQTGYNQDYLWSSEDYNRFDTSPGVFEAPNFTIPGIFYPGSNGDIFCDPQLGCANRLVAEDLDVEHAWQFSQEFRVASNYSGPFNFSMGGNYLHYETDENYYVFVNALSAYSYKVDAPYFNGSMFDANACLQQAIGTGKYYGGWQNTNPKLGGGEPTYPCPYIDQNPIGSLNNKGHNYFISQNPYTLNSYAGFGEAYYNLAPDLKITAGLRYTIDNKHFVDIPSDIIGYGIGYTPTGIENQQWDRLTGRAVLNWTPKLDFTDQSMFYASYAHGYKAGGANPPGAIFVQYAGATTVSFAHPLTFKPEYIEAFEVGTKNTLLDNSLTLNGDIFYYNYTGYQISEIVDRTAINNNYNAHVEGAEIQANWEPLPGLKFNFAGGWEDSAAAGGDSGIDLMDRTAGTPGWMVVKPFPTEASNCILPDYVIAALLQVQQSLGGGGNEAGFACETAYTKQLDPVTGLPYQLPTPTSGNDGLIISGVGITWTVPTGYPGFNPSNPAINNGEGFAKNLTGHSLPNAPPFTVSLGGEYSMPISEDWAGTFRTDFYWQADSWARIFNDNPYDRIHGYTNVNLALILSSANGWQVMGYIKNVFNTTAITGDFLNSDDSGLTTNVFLTDPRLFGVRVTKQLDDSDGFWGSDYNGADFFTGLFSDKDGGKPQLWIEWGGQAEHLQGEGAVFAPGFLSNPAFATSSVLWKGTTPTQAQRPALFDFGQEAKVSFEPEGSDWIVTASARYGRSSSFKAIDHQTGDAFFELYKSGAPYVTRYGSTGNRRGIDKFSNTNSHRSESHSVIDFTAGKDIGLGIFGPDSSSILSAGLRFAQFVSHSSVDMRARPDLEFKYPSIIKEFFPSREAKWPYFHTYHASGQAARKFHGLGPMISWTGSSPLTGETDGGQIEFDWGANGAILFGRQKANVRHHESGHYVKTLFVNTGNYFTAYPARNGGHTSNRTVTVPNLGGFAGISYRYANAKISLGYRADFFFGAIDGGIDKRKSETLNMSGPFATISFGLGG